MGGEQKGSEGPKIDRYNRSEPRYSLLNLRDEPGLEGLGCPQRLGGLTAEQELVLRQLGQQQPNDLSQIHAADHLLEAVGGGQSKTITRGGSRREDWRSGQVRLHVDAGVDGRLVHRHVKGRLDVLQGAVVTESTPLGVDTHAAVLALHALHVPHLLHVAGVCSRTFRDEDKHQPGKTFA